jgi:hypothetical protein
MNCLYTKNKQTPWPLIRERTIPTKMFNLVRGCVQRTILMRYKNETNAVAFGPQEIYTNRAAATCRRNLCQLLWLEGCRLVSGTKSHDRQSRLYRPQPLLFIQLASQLFSRGWVDPVKNPPLLRKSGSTGNRTRYLWIWSQELWPLDDLPITCIYEKFISKCK